MNKRMRVELQLSGSDERTRSCPTELCTTTRRRALGLCHTQSSDIRTAAHSPLSVFVGDMAVLSDGPPLGTPVGSTGRRAPVAA